MPRRTLVDRAAAGRFKFCATCGVIFIRRNCLRRVALRIRVRWGLAGSVCFEPIVHDARRIELEGESLRKKRARTTSPDEEAQA